MVLAGVQLVLTGLLACLRIWSAKTSVQNPVKVRAHDSTGQTCPITLTMISFPSDTGYYN